MSASPQRFPPTEIDLEFGEGSKVFKLGARQIADLQEKRGRKVGWPDGSAGLRPKPFGTIWREHMTGDYDLADSVEILIQGRVHAHEDRSRLSASKEVLAVIDGWPAEEIWKHAVAVLVATAQGYRAPEDDPPGESKAKARKQKTSSSTSQPRSGTSGEQDRATTAS